MEKNTTVAAQEKLRKEALKSALTATSWHGLSALALLYLRFALVTSVGWGIVLIVMALLVLGVVAIAWVSYKNTLAEIEAAKNQPATE